MHQRADDEAQETEFRGAESGEDQIEYGKDGLGIHTWRRYVINHLGMGSHEKGGSLTAVEGSSGWKQAKMSTWDR